MFSVRKQCFLVCGAVFTGSEHENFAKHQYFMIHSEFEVWIPRDSCSGCGKRTLACMNNCGAATRGDVLWDNHFCEYLFDDSNLWKRLSRGHCRRRKKDRTVERALALCENLRPTSTLPIFLVTCAMTLPTHPFHAYRTRCYSNPRARPQARSCAQRLAATQFKSMICYGPRRRQAAQPRHQRDRARICTDRRRAARRRPGADPAGATRGEHAGGVRGCVRVHVNNEHVGVRGCGWIYTTHTHRM